MGGMDDLYREQILEHHRTPHNFGQLAEPTISVDGRNPSCGDLITMQLQLDAEGLITDVFNGDLTLYELLTDQFLRDLHRQLYGDIWTWAGRWRSPEINLGVAPEQIAVDLQTTMDNIRRSI